MRYTHHPWWSLNAWVSSILFTKARKAPKEMDVLLASAYGISEALGVGRLSAIIFRGILQFLNKKLRGRNV